MLSRIRTRLVGMSKAKKILFIAVLFLLITSAGASAWYYQRLSNLEKMFPEVANLEPSERTSESGGIHGAFGHKTLNILLLGFDRDEARDEIYTCYRADVIMVASVNLDTGKVDVLSIPRDTLVPIYGLEGIKDKINSAYTYGWQHGGAPKDDQEKRHRIALDYQVQTVSQALKGVPIHYYLTIDMDGVVEAVDTVGGIWYESDTRVYDKYGKLIVDSGRQLVDGETFLRFVRNRHFSSGDLQRVKNQQSILLAAFAQFKSTGTLMHIPQLYSDLNSRIETNLSLEQMLSLALFASQKIAPANIETHVLATSSAFGRLHSSWEKSYSYLIIDQEQRAELIKQIWGLEVTVDPIDKILPPLPKEEPIPEGAEETEAKEEEIEETEGTEEAGGAEEIEETEETGETEAVAETEAEEENSPLVPIEDEQAPSHQQDQDSDDE